MRVGVFRRWSEYVGLKICRIPAKAFNVNFVTRINFNLTIRGCERKDFEGILPPMRIPAETEPATVGTFITKVTMP